MTRPPGKASLLVVFLTVFIDLLGFGIVLPLLPIYAEDFAAGMDRAQVGWTIGLLMASFSAMQFFFAPIWGRLSDRVGRRPLLLLGLAGSVGCYTLFGLATIWGSLTWLFVSRIGAGIAGATISTAQAYIADVTSVENRARGMALIGAAFGLGFTLGPLLGAAALVLAPDDAGRSPWPGFLAAALSAGALGLAWFRLPESLPAAGAARRPLEFSLATLRAALLRPSVAALLAASLLSGLAFANMESTLSRNLAHWNGEPSGESSPPDEVPAASAGPAAEIAASPATRDDDRASASRHQANRRVLLVFVYIGLVLTLSQGFLVRRLARRLSEGVMAGGGGVLSVLGFALLAWAVAREDWYGLLVALAVEIVGFSFVSPSLNSLISRRSDPAQQGGILGLVQSTSSLARIFGPVLGNRLLEESPAWPYWFATGLMLAGLGLLTLGVRSGGDFAPSDAGPSSS